MISNQILQNTIDGVKGITKIDLSGCRWKCIGRDGR